MFLSLHYAVRSLLFDRLETFTILVDGLQSSDTLVDGISRAVSRLSDLSLVLASQDTNQAPELGTAALGWESGMD